MCFTQVPFQFVGDENTLHDCEIYMPRIPKPRIFKQGWYRKRYRLNECLRKKRRCHGDARYTHTLALGELIIIQGRKSDKLYEHLGHIIDITAQRYRLLLGDGTIRLRAKTVCFNPIREQGQSLKKKDFPKKFPAPANYCRPVPYGDRFPYKHGTEHFINTSSDESECSDQFDSDSTESSINSWHTAYKVKRDEWENGVVSAIVPFISIRPLAICDSKGYIGYIQGGRHIHT